MFTSTMEEGCDVTNSTNYRMCDFDVKGNVNGYFGCRSSNEIFGLKLGRSIYRDKIQGFSTR